MVGAVIELGRVVGRRGRRGGKVGGGGGGGEGEGGRSGVYRRRKGPVPFRIMY